MNNYLKTSLAVLLLVLLSGCQVKPMALSPDNYDIAKIDTHKSECLMLKYHDDAVELKYQGFENDEALFYFNPTDFVTEGEGKVCSKDKTYTVSLSSAKRRAFPGGLGDQREVVYLTGLVEEIDFVITAQGESDTYWVFPIPGDRGKAVTEAVIRALQDLNTKIITVLTSGN